MALHTELHPHFEGYLSGILFLQSSNFRCIFRIIHIGYRHLFRFTGSSPAPGYAARIVPVILDAVVHMVGKADFIQPQGNGIPHNIFHEIQRIVTVTAVYMIISEHLLSSFLVSELVCLFRKQAADRQIHSPAQFSEDICTAKRPPAPPECRNRTLSSSPKIPSFAISSRPANAFPV